MVARQWVSELSRKSESLMVHLGSEKEKEIEMKREKGRIKNNKEKK